MIVVYTQDGTYIRNDADAAKDVLASVYGEKLGTETFTTMKRCMACPYTLRTPFRKMRLQ